MQLFCHRWSQSVSPHHSGPKIVLLHGMGGTGALWRPIAATLEKDFDLLAPDQRGHGKSLIPHIPGSRSPVTYFPKDYAKDVIETLQASQFHPTWLIGHSMGVRTAVATAYLQREWIKGLILIDLGFSGVAGGGLGEGLAQFIKVLPQSFESRAQAREFMNTQCPDPSIAQYLMAVSKLDHDGKLTFPFDHSALIQTIHSAQDFSVREWVKDLAQEGLPIHVLRGEQSRVWTHEEFEFEKEIFSPYSSIQFHEFQNAGHGLPFEQRTLFVEFVRSALLH